MPSQYFAWALAKVNVIKANDTHANHAGFFSCGTTLVAVLQAAPTLSCFGRQVPCQPPLFSSEVDSCFADDAGCDVRASAFWAMVVSMFDWLAGAEGRPTLGSDTAGLGAARDVWLAAGVRVPVAERIEGCSSGGAEASMLATQRSISRCRIPSGSRGVPWSGTLREYLVLSQMPRPTNASTAKTPPPMPPNMAAWNDGIASEMYLEVVVSL